MPLPFKAVGTPSWVMPGALFDLDFINNRYYGGWVDVRPTSIDKLALAANNSAYAASNPYTPTTRGILYQGLQGQNRITDLGLFIERASTNECLWCRDLTNAAWAKTTATVAKNQTGADGAANTCSSITATVSLATVLQSITLSSKQVTFSAYIKRIIGTGTVKITMDGTTYTDVTSQLTSTGYTWVQMSALQTLSTVLCGFQLGTSGDAIAVDFAQLELAPLTGNKATTPIFTTTAAVSRTNEDVYFQSTATVGATANAGQRINHDVFSSGGPFSMLWSFNGDCTATIPQGPGMIATDFMVPAGYNGGVGVGFGNSTQRTPNQGTNGRGNWNKACAVCNGHGTIFVLNGGAPSAYATGGGNTPNLNVLGTHFNIGNNGSGTGDLPLNGSIGRATFWNKELTQGLMMEFTNLTNPYGTY